MPYDWEHPVPLFSRRKELAVQSFMLKVVNNHCQELEALAEGPRLEGRVRLTVVVLVIPVEDGRPAITQLFAAVTKEFSTSGVSLVLNEPRSLDHVILGLRHEGGLHFVHAKAKHLNPMGAGFYQLGLQLTKMVQTGDYPELEAIRF